MRILKLALVVGLAWVLFIGLADILAQVLRWAGILDSLGWGLYGIGLGMSLVCAATAVYLVRSGRGLSAPAAFVLGGVGAFTAIQMCFYAVPDWDPVPTLTALVAGLASGLTVLILWTRQSTGSAED